MASFLYTFTIILIALSAILGMVSILTDHGEEPVKTSEGRATAAMCTTRLLETTEYKEEFFEGEFVIEQDLVYTYDSINVE